MKHLHILVVEDDADLAEAISDALELAGHRPTVAGTGKEAIEIYGRQPFDITFMDVRLPDANGVDVFLSIRESDPNARVVMMTGHQVDELLARATKKGAIKVLLKPFAMEAILETLSDAGSSGIILVADDDSEFVEGIGNLLALHGYDVVVARDGREAVDRVLDSDPDVLLLDLRLPVLHGLEVYLELERRGRGLPTIIVTGYREEEAAAIEKLKSLSVADCLSKPVDPVALTETIASINPKRRAAR